MKNRTHIALGFAVALLVAAIAPSASFAGQGAGRAAAEGGKGMAVRAIDAIDHATQADAVKLDDEEKTKVHEVIEDATAQAQSIQADLKASKTAGKDKTDRQTIRQSVVELLAQTKQRVEAILTDTQKTAFRAALADERAKLRAERGTQTGPRGGKGGGRGGATTQPTA